MIISVNGREVGRGRIEQTIMSTAGLGETLDIGRDAGVPVTREYAPDAPAGAISKVQVKLAAPQQKRPGPTLDLAE
jgi:hypothetical protein